MLVVDLLEVIDVEHDQRQRPLVTRAARDLAVERLEEVALVVGLRETIDDGHAVDLFVVRRLDVRADEELEDRVADLEQVAVAQAILRDLFVVHVAAVGRAEIFHGPAGALARDLRVAARHGIAIDLDVAVGATADRALGVAELEALPQLGPARIDQYQASLLRVGGGLLDRPDLCDPGLPVVHAFYSTPKFRLHPYSERYSPEPPQPGRQLRKQLGLRWVPRYLDLRPPRKHGLFVRTCVVIYAPKQHADSKLAGRSR